MNLISGSWNHIIHMKESCLTHEFIAGSWILSQVREIGDFLYSLLPRLECTCLIAVEGQNVTGFIHVT